MSLYTDALESSQKQQAASRKRSLDSMNEVINWMDFLDAAGYSGNPVGAPQRDGTHSAKAVATGISNKINAAGGSLGPSTGPIPALMSYNWRDPIDSQVFHLTTARGTKKNFKPFLSALAATGYDIDSLGSYAYRNARGSNRLSEHAYGRAIDINPSSNPMGQNLVTDLPNNIARLAALYGLVWGGTWKSKKDPMHFSTSGY